MLFILLGIVTDVSSVQPLKAPGKIPTTSNVLPLPIVIEEGITTEPEYLPLTRGHT